jgi:hypothetical protein
LWYKELMSKCTTLCYKAAKIPLSWRNICISPFLMYLFFWAYLIVTLNVINYHFTEFICRGK